MTLKLSRGQRKSRENYLYSNTNLEHMLSNLTTELETPDFRENRYNYFDYVGIFSVESHLSQMKDHDVGDRKKNHLHINIG